MFTGYLAIVTCFRSPMTDYYQHASLHAALQHSRYLTRLFTKYPELANQTAATLATPYTRQDMQTALHRCGNTETAIKCQLRQLRQHVMARLICRDLAGLANLTEIMHTVSDLAEVCLLHALQFLQVPHERYGQPIGEESGTLQRLLIVGMGKLGGRELNVSSDIDLIFIYPEEGETNGSKRISNHEYFTLIGKKLIQFLDEITEQGFVFRVDMRLRPFGESGPLVSSFTALENYLITQGREWERYAWVKGREITPEHPDLMSIIRPFIYRKYLDYGAYASMRTLHKQIRAEILRTDRVDNIKLGPGGIREIEFIAQVFQLIRGGRFPLLQQRATQAILTQLDSMGLLPTSIITALQNAYIFLRNLEHRLQYLDDAQTQNLPKNLADQTRIASSMGFATYADFLGRLNQHRRTVTQHFEQVFTLPDEGLEQVADPNALLGFNLAEKEQTEALFTSLGYNDPQALRQLLSSLAQSPRYLQLNERSKKRLDTLMPALLTISATLPDPDATIQRICRLLENISRRESYLALLAEHPQTLQRLAKLYSASPWVSDYLTQHPILLDELLDTRVLYQPLDWATLATELNQQLNSCDGDAEAQMEGLRHFQHTQIFRLVAQDLAGLLSLETLSDHLSALADLCLQSAMAAIWKEIKPHPRASPHFAVIAYGKLGGKELGYTSDLDLVFLYDDRIAGADEMYMRFAKKMVSWLTVATAVGQLYEIDLRLRPNGASGLLVSSLAAFQQYQTERAWLWEHQALTRARFVAGDSNIAIAFNQMRENVLRLPRDQPALKTDILAMRQRIQHTHPPQSNDVKYGPGGLVDIEFIVQYLILAYAQYFPDLTQNSGNIALLATAARHQLIDASLAESARSAYRGLRRIQHTAGLHGNGLPEAAALNALINDRLAVQQLWQLIFKNARQ